MHRQAWLIGRPMANEEEIGERLPKKLALPIFSSDAISSSAYATEEILFVTAVGGSSLALGLSKLVPIAALSWRGLRPAAERAKSARRMSESFSIRRSTRARKLRALRS